MSRPPRGPSQRRDLLVFAVAVLVRRPVANKIVGKDITSFVQVGLNGCHAVEWRYLGQGLGHRRANHKEWLRCGWTLWSDRIQRQRSRLEGAPEGQAGAPGVADESGGTVRHG